MKNIVILDANGIMREILHGHEYDKMSNLYEGMKDRSSYLQFAIVAIHWVIHLYLK